jgi:hypothetical protein
MTAATPPQAIARTIRNTAYWKGLGSGNSIANTIRATTNITPKAKPAIFSQDCGETWLDVLSGEGPVLMPVPWYSSVRREEKEDPF